MIKELTNEELKMIYQKHMKQDFPPNELKPLMRIEQQRRKKRNTCLGFFEEDSLSGYAILEKCDKNQCLLLDYFAIFESKRASGKGTLFLQELCFYLEGIDALFIESETAINATAERRLQFYKRSGARITSIHARLFHVDYHILILPFKQNYTDAEIVPLLNELYNSIYPPFFRNLYLKISLK